MECAKVQDLLSAFLKEGPAGDDLSRVAAHLDHCRECAAAAEGLKGTLVLLGSLPRHAAPPELLGNVLRRVAEEGDAGRAWRRLFRSGRFRIPVEAAAAVLLFLLVYGIQREAPESPAPPAAPPVVRQTRPAEAAAPAKRDGNALPATARAESQRAPDIVMTEPLRAPDSAAEGSEKAASAARDGKGREVDGRTGAATAKDGRVPPAHDALERPTAPREFAKTARGRGPLPAAPATRASSLAEPVAPPAKPAAPPGPAGLFAAPPSRLMRPLPFGREVILEVTRDSRQGIEDRIAEAARRRGGFVHGDDAGREADAGKAEEAAGAVRVHIPAGAAGPFLDDLKGLGTVPPEGLPAAVDIPAGPSPEFVAYTVRIRVR